MGATKDAIAEISAIAMPEPSEWRFPGCRALTVRKFDHQDRLQTSLVAQPDAQVEQMSISPCATVQGLRICARRDPA